MQSPKFIVEPDKAGDARWKVEADNADITGMSPVGYPTKEEAARAIKQHIETVIGAANISISLGTEFEPLIEYIGYEQPTPEPPAEGPYPDHATEEPAEAEG